MIIILGILIIDQMIKIWVKTHMTLGESITIFSWFKIYFIENNGMAYGMELGSKLFLTLFRIVAVSAIGWYLYKIIRQHTRSTGFIVCLAMIEAGAAGNIFDCLFYGQIFAASSAEYVSYFVPFGSGYAPLMMGKVVDMFYFPLIDTTYPQWMPFWAGERFVFFAPVFNFADSAISVATAILLLFYRKELSTTLS